ncbi:hypothetical protein B0H13DRAFT_1952338 [Mycena leptocephala]|nr:hypothetical protein B0H13DRAFT_1952338 [Mycena leptocephala]
MESTTASIAPTLQLVHNVAAQIMSLLPADTNITEGDRRRLQDYYQELEQRHALVSQGTSSLDRYDEDEETVDDDDILDEELKKAAAFPAFLKSLDSGDDAAKILIEGSKRVLSTLGMVEKGANFLVNVSMQKILDMYESIKSREERLRADGTPVSLVGAKIYSEDTVRFADAVEAMIVSSIQLGEASLMPFPRYWI